MKALIVAAVTAVLSMSMINCLQAAGYYETDIEVDIVSDNRGVLSQYPITWQHDEVEQSYVEARDQERYSLRLRNNTSQRVGVVIAVDGRNIISGKKSYLDSNERMYVLGPWQVAEYGGWRTAKNRVNRFYFTDEYDSYSATWEDYSAMGVIAVAAFAERKPKSRRQGSKEPRRSIASRQKSPMSVEPGTGMGEDTLSPSRKVRFKPKKKPLMEKVIKYEWRSSLCRKHIISCREYRGRRDRNRFWPEENWGSTHGYAPRRW